MKNLILFLLCIAHIQLFAAMPDDFLKDNRRLAIIVGSGISGVQDGISWELKLGGLVGAQVRLLVIGEGSGLYTGMNITCQGAAYKEDIDTDYYYTEFSALKSTQAGEGFSGKVNMSYINIPLFYRYQHENGFFGEAGLQTSFLLSAKDKIDGAGSYDFKDSVKGIDFGVNIGAGYRINDNLSAGVKMMYGLLNFNDTGSSEKAHNYMVLATLSYDLNFNFK